MDSHTLRRAALTLASLGLLALPSRGQVPPPEEPSPITIGEIKIQPATLPGSELAWTKILIAFSSSQKWLDGLVLNVQALLDEKGNKRVVSGLVRYGNIPQGPQVAVLYISPRATARFGAPIAVKVAAMQNDREAGTKSWTNASAAVPQDWSALNVYPGVLLNVMQTPWLMLDYEKSPDVIPIQ